MFGFLNRRAKAVQQQKELLAEAEKRLSGYADVRADLEKQKQNKLQRQVELWGVMTPTSELESEYKNVAADITFLEKKLLRLKDLNDKLNSAYQLCRGGQCDTLQGVLGIVDLFADITPDVPKVEYTISRKQI